MEIHWVGAQSIIDEELAHLQAVFIKQTRELRQRRNALTPIYRLPPELLSRIFFATLTQNQEKKHRSRLNPAARIHKGRRNGVDNYEFSSWPQTRKPDVLPLCHVSQYWRSVALSSPELWNHIQVDLRMKPELLDFMRTSARKLPLILDLDADNGVPPWSHFDSRLILSDILGAGAGQLKSLAFCCDSGVISRDVLGGVMAPHWTPAPAQQLESLEIIIDEEVEDFVSKMFSMGTPNLRYLDVRGTALPWTSPLFESSHLTHTTLHNIPHLDSSTLDQFLNFLRRATQLVSLYLCLPRQKDLALHDDDVPSTRFKLPPIDTLQLVSEYFAPLSIVMKSIEVEDVDTLEVSCGEATHNLRPICDFSAPLEPLDSLEIGYQPSGITKGYTICCDQEFVTFDGDGFEIDLDIWRDEVPWIAMNTGRQFPFPPAESSLYRVPWVLSSLQLISIGNMGKAGIPQRFWEELANLPTLRVVCLKWARIAIVQGFSRSMVMSMKRSTASPSASSATFALQQDEEIKDCVSHPYPALRAVTFDSMDEAVKECRSDSVEFGYRVNSPPWRDMHPTELYLKIVLSNFRAWAEYGNRKLDELRFSREGSGGEDPKLEEVNKAVVWSLRRVAKHVRLGERRYVDK